MSEDTATQDTSFSSETETTQSGHLDGDGLSTDRSEGATRVEPVVDGSAEVADAGKGTATEAADSPASEDPSGSDDSTEEDEDGGSVLDTEGEIAADYLEELLDIADFDGDIDTYVESNRAHVSILTEGDVLVGANGQVLEALQELSRLAVMTETGNRSRLMLDVGGYRDRRRKVLVELATEAVEDVKSSGDSVRLNPMNPFERKIIHDVVAAGGLVSESEGEEPGRRVVILPKA